MRLRVNSFLASSDLASADSLCKQFVPRSGPTKCPDLDPNMVFLKEFFEMPTKA